MESQSTQESTPVAQKPKEVKLVDIPIVDETTALNVIVSFLSVAQKRGAFSIDESAKIWECINKFNHN
jgi:glutathione synthase/RimK-type ligase-like ATP-grasp enzyme